MVRRSDAGGGGGGGTGGGVTSCYANAFRTKCGMAPSLRLLFSCAFAGGCGAVLPLPVMWTIAWRTDLRACNVASWVVHGPGPAFARCGQRNGSFSAIAQTDLARPTACVHNALSQRWP